MENIKNMDYKKIDSQIFKIARKVNLISALRPKNLRQEKEKFFESKSYNPRFRYRKSILDFDELRRRLKKLKTDNSPLGVIFKRKCAELIKRLDIIKAVGTENFTRKAQVLYRKPGISLLKRTNQQLQNTPIFTGEIENISSKEAKRRFEQKLKRYGLKWKVILKENLVPDCYVGSSSICIKKNISFSEPWLRKTIIHEIDTHILRKENGKVQPYKIFRCGLAGFIQTEEGLAVYNEQNASRVQSKKDFLWAIYVLACSQALRSSFRDIFDMVKAFGYSCERAWIVAVKVKRGLTDTSSPGGFMKDSLYFSEKYKIESHLKQGGDLRKLYLGKIGIEDLPLVERVLGIKEPKYLPKFLTD